MSICSLVVVLCFISFNGLCLAEEMADDTITVQGTGYPPIRAESAAQAHLMAKRAALVHAYRNALSPSSPSPAPSSGDAADVTYQELSGFVRGVTIVNEEYLGDGGIRITAKVPKKNITVSTVRTEINKSGGSAGPQRVSRDEWYSIISNLVKIDK